MHSNFFTLFYRYFHKIFLCKSAVQIMFLCICILQIKLFQTITQSFYIALSHINIRTRNKISAGVIIIRAGGPAKNFLKFFRKNLTVPKIVPKMSHSICLDIETNFRMLS